MGIAKLDELEAREWCGEDCQRGKVCCSREEEACGIKWCSLLDRSHGFPACHSLLLYCIGFSFLENKLGVL